MGMCKGCKNIFKTETMSHGFCVNCMDSDKYIEEVKIINSGTKEIEKLKNSRTIWLLIFVISSPLAWLLIVEKAGVAASLPIVFLILSIFKLIEISFSLRKYTHEKKPIKVLYFIKNYSKYIYFIGFVLIIVFPPHYNKAGWIRYEFILGSSLPIHFSTFIAILLGYIFIGGVFYFLFVKSK